MRRHDLSVLLLAVASSGCFSARTAPTPEGGLSELATRVATYADVVLQDGSAFRLYHATYASDSLVGFNGPSFTSERRAIPHDSVSVIRIREFDPARTVTVGLAIVGAAIVIPIVVFLMMLTGGP